MKIKQTIRNFVAALLLVGGVVTILTPVTALAADNSCGTETAILKCNNVDPNSKDIKRSAIWDILAQVINIMAAGVGVLALAGIVYGAVLYTSSGGNQEQVKKAITIFTNVGIGVLAFAGMFVLLNFLIPGGVF